LDGMTKRRIVSAAALLAGLATAAAGLAGCATVNRWLASREAGKPPFRVVNPGVANEIVRDAPDVFILDLRSPEEFQGPKGHLRNALNMPLGRMPYRLLEIRNFRGETFLVYCGSDECGRTGMRILKDSGFPDAILIDGGVDAWLRAGFITFVRASRLRPPNARVRTERNPELVPDAEEPGGELPVIPPPLPPSPPSPPSAPGLR
jgi:rhodanese-related sulfurtransferase